VVAAAFTNPIPVIPSTTGMPASVPIRNTRPLMSAVSSTVVCASSGASSAGKAVTTATIDTGAPGDPPLSPHASGDAASRQTATPIANRCVPHGDRTPMARAYPSGARSGKADETGRCTSLTRSLSRLHCHGPAVHRASRRVVPCALRALAQGLLALSTDPPTRRVTGGCNA
jgi:hypothetical protein